MEVGTDEFGKMYQMYFDDVLRAVYHRISDRQTAEDITQDTFVAAFKLGGIPGASEAQTVAAAHGPQ